MEVEKATGDIGVPTDRPIPSAAHNRSAGEGIESAGSESRETEDLLRFLMLFC